MLVVMFADELDRPDEKVAVVVPISARVLTLQVPKYVNESIFLLYEAGIG